MPNKKYRSCPNAFSILTIAILSLLNASCNRQIEQENPDTEPVTNDTITHTDKRKDTTPYNPYKDGLRKTFYENGQLKTAGNYRADLKEGLHKEWQYNGILLLEGFYEKGIANGWMKWYHERGHLAAEGNMVDGRREGKWKICDIEENGFCIEAYFKDDKRDGIWKINHDNISNKLWKEQTWENDRIVFEKCWDKNGIAIKCE